MAFPEGAERRWLVFCVSERPEENAALWQWCTTSLFDPHRDSVTFLYCRTEANVILVRRPCPRGVRAWSKRHTWPNHRPPPQLHARWL